MRSVCLACRRPKSACFCSRLPSLESRTRVVFLQHPRERRVAIGTARLAHLSLKNSEFHSGLHFSGHPRLEELARSEDVAVLFPSPDAAPLEALGPRPLKTLVVIDGTWPQAKKLLKENPLLQKLPRVGFTPVRPGNYRIRKEPAEHCLSTIEAVAEVLGKLEGDAERFQAMLRPFDAMVDHQIECKDTREGPPRRKHRKGAKPTRLPPELTERHQDLVLFYAESNAHGADSGKGFPPELVQWVAVRPSTGERFEALVQPRFPLAEPTPHHLELPAEAFAQAERLEVAKERFSAFIRPTDIWCGWGFYALSLLAGEGMKGAQMLDLRQAASQRLQRKAGELEALAAHYVAKPLAPRERGRAGRRIAALEQVLEGLCRGLP